MIKISDCNVILIKKEDVNIDKILFIAQKYTINIAEDFVFKFLIFDDKVLLQYFDEELIKENIQYPFYQYDLPNI